MTANVAPFGFQHLVQPQAWLCAVFALISTLTGLSVHLQDQCPAREILRSLFDTVVDRRMN